MYQELVPDSQAKKAAGAAAIVAGVPGAREVALRDLGSGSEANMPMMPDIYGNQDIDPNSPGPAQITDPNAPQNIASQRQSTPEMGTERQDAITEQGRGARYDENSIMGLLSSLVGNPKANEAFDSTKPIGGANVPYQSAGGLQRFFGNQANQLNLGAQQAQGAEWKQEAKELKAEERALNRLREADKPAAERFTTQLAENKAIRDAESATRLRERGEDETTRKGERTQDRVDRLARETAAEKTRLQEREDRLAQQLQENALRDATFGQNQLRANQPSMTGLPGGGMGVFDPSSRSISIVNPGTVGFGNIPGTPSTTRQVYPPPQFKPSGSGSGQVDRGTGATLGGPLPVDAGVTPAPAPAMTPPRSADTSPMAEASLLGRFKQAMPSLNLERYSGPGVQSPYLSEGEMGQRVMEQIAYPLRAAVADEAKGEFQNPQAAFSVLSRPPMFRLKRPDSMEMQQSRKAADILRQMYAE